MYISDELIDKFIREDVPYIDLTTLILGIGDQKVPYSFFQGKTLYFVVQKKLRKSLTG